MFIRLRGAVVSVSHHEYEVLVRIPARVVGAQLIQLFTLPFGVIDKWVSRETRGT